MPAQQQPRQAGFPCAGWTDDGHVGAGWDMQIDTVQQSMAAGMDGDIFQNDFDPGQGSFGQLCHRGGIPFDRCAQRLHEAQGQVAVHRILPRQEGDLLAERRDVERPVGQE